MKSPFFLILAAAVFLVPFTLPAYQDYSHYSQVFQTSRSFRVFTPPSYNPSNTAKRYPVIFYLNGCGGNYASNYGSYSRDGRYTQPYASSDLEYRKPFNGEFEVYVQDHDVIVISLDGNIPNLGGCGVYYPYSLDSVWTGNDFNFSRYLPEIISVIDSIFRTYKDPQYRAVTGLSMGGHESIWISAANPHIIRSASHFSFSPPSWLVGPPGLTTPVEDRELWRNFRGLSFRTSTNDQDYIFHPSFELHHLFSGAGFPTSFHKAIFWRHWAADIDSQFDFHMATFSTPRPPVKCFSYVNLYPVFDVWNYTVTSQKAVPGWIYLRDVTRNGMGILTRRQLPFGNPLANFQIQLTTAPVYTANQSYSLVRYNYGTGSFSTGSASANSAGRLTLTSNGGMGEEIGITGAGLAPAVAVLADTVNETFYLRSGADTALSFEVVNLTESPLSSVVFRVTAGGNSLQILSGSKTVNLPAKGKVRIDSLVVVRAQYSDNGDPRYFNNSGFLKITAEIQGALGDREQFFRMQILDQPSTRLSDTDVVIIDGRQVQDLMVYNFSYDAFEGQSPFTINEGAGNGDGVADSGEVVSLWIRLAAGLSPYDSNGWHPTMPLFTGANPDIELSAVREWSLNRVRPLLSAQIRLRRKPTVANPILIPLFTEIFEREPSPGAHQANSIDAYLYRYHTVVLPAGAIAVEQPGDPAVQGLFLSCAPNPFNPAVRIRVSAGPSAGRAPALAAAIFDLRGRQVREFKLAGAPGKGGRFDLVWDGRDGSGVQNASGVYFFRLNAGGRTLIQKLVLAQ